MNDHHRLGHVGHQQHHIIRNTNQHPQQLDLPNNSNNNSNSGNNNCIVEVDVLASSESAHIQEFRLYRELSREIDKNTNDRVRYVDSELYQQRNQYQATPDSRYSNPSSSSEVQSSTQNIGGTPQAGSRSKVKQTNSASSSSSSSKTQVQATSSNKFYNTNNDELDKSSFSGDRTATTTTTTPNGMHRTTNQRQIINNNDDASKHRAMLLDGNCQVCLIKGLKDDLMHVTRVIQEKNEQLLAELRAKRPRALFERLDQ